MVMKFGGTSIANAAAFENVAQIVLDHVPVAPIVVVSAMSCVTDALLEISRLAKVGSVDVALTSLDEIFEQHASVARALFTNQHRQDFFDLLETAQGPIAKLLHLIATEPHLDRMYEDELLAWGETLSSNLLARALCFNGAVARSVDARTCILTDDQYGNAAPLMSETFALTKATLNHLLNDRVIPVLGGFIGATIDGNTTTLGRGGSDYTAAIVGAALNVLEIQIWTDVTGVLTADPRVVPDAQTIASLSYGEAAELAYFGAKVLHPKTIQPATERKIPVRICNSRERGLNGTIVCATTQTAPQTVKAIAYKTGVTTIQITSARMLGAYGFLRALFEIFDRHRTVVDVVTTSEVSVSLSVDDARSLPQIVEELQALGTVRVEPGRAIICVVGEGLRGTPGIAATVFSTIGNINVTLISQGASSVNLTFAVEEDRAEEVVRRLHAAFFEHDKLDGILA
ncbi:MAG TPA: lysine-sensitive aspartokinase 3 [Pyrinomonadaceae bacterium]|nr:lysine-sensitive aspartokinase 3 [Pyrinomonadaceae bacterium]